MVRTTLSALPDRVSGACCGSWASTAQGPSESAEEIPAFAGMTNWADDELGG